MSEIPLSESPLFRPLSRRQWLQQSGSGIGAVALAGLLAESRSFPAATAATAAASEPAGAAARPSPLSAQAPHFPARVKRVIHLFMNGGPSQIDTFDPKPLLSELNGRPLPDAAREKLQPTQRKRVGKLFGSPFAFRNHGESGLPVSELFPHVARHVDDLCIVRSMQGEVANHTPGLLLTNCGHSTLPRPCLGSWLLYGLGNESDELPGFVVLCPRGMPTAQSRNWTSAFLPGVYQGAHIDPLSDRRNPIPDLTRDDVAPETQRRQVELAQFLNERHRQARPEDPRLESRIHNMELAFRMQTAASDVLQLNQERAATRALYGDTVQGRNLLLARRLVERGVRYVQCYHGGGQPWDNHGAIVPRIKQLARDSDQAIGALLTDLKQRGMLDETLVLWGGEMGRTPTTQSQSQDLKKVGRDHHIDGYTIWMAGGGFRGGLAYGATDELGMEVAENKVTLHDLHATILHQLGLDHRRLTYRYSGRDFRLTDVHGRIVHSLLS